MTAAAFYAPMKPPDDPVPSGDRAMAQALQLAFAEAGLKTEVVSRFRSRDGKGDPARQQELIRQAETERARLVAQGRSANWRVWVTYHNYYKAPDLLGPQVAAALDIPYILIESTRARKRLQGPWAVFAKAAEAATDAAAAVLYLTERDAEALHAYRPADQLVAPLPPFLPQKSLSTESTRTGGILSVGMMRNGDKLASYHLIAETLALLKTDEWQISLAGDGPARRAVETLMAPFGSHVTFLGALSSEGLQNVYGKASLLFWPGINEAFGMAYLEAQAAGMAVVSQDRPGVRDVLAPGADYPSPEAGAAGLAARLDMLLISPKLTAQLGKSARGHIAEKHLIGAASARLEEVVAKVLS